MTIEMVLVAARLKERHALTRVRRAIAANAVEADWAYVLAAIDAQLYALQKLLEQDDPQIVRDGEALLAGDTGGGRPQPDVLAPARASAPTLPALPKGSLVH